MSLLAEGKRAESGRILKNHIDSIAELEAQITEETTRLANLRDELVACNDDFSGRSEITRFTNAIAERKSQLEATVTAMDSDDDFTADDTTEYQTVIDDI